MLRLLALPLIAIAGCTELQTESDIAPSTGGAQGLPFEDVTETALPTGSLGGLTMDAAPVDVDNDGDLDIVLAHEFRPNILLINDGTGNFQDESAQRLPRANHDSEDVGVADFDNDGDMDVIVVSEDDQTNEFYINDGRGFFVDETRRRLPVTGVTNGVAVGDIDGDGDSDLVFANNGQNFVLVNNGAGAFADETAIRLPPRGDTSQDVELGDVDGDLDLDLLVGNEEDNRLLLNDGAGLFTDASNRLPQRDAVEETREADFGDIDNDGDLDIFFANVRFFQPGAVLENRLLINDGRGFFADETARLPQHDDHTVDGDFVDVDGDGSLDIVTANADRLSIGGQAPYRVLLNDGTGAFDDRTRDIFPESVRGIGFDVEAADLNRDGLLDVYFASRRGVDRLAIGRE